MIELIFGDIRREDRKVVLCATEEMDNPFPDQVLFIQGKSLSDYELLSRAGVISADRVIIYRSNDDKTLTSCLTVTAMTKTAHIVAWFEYEHMVKLLKSHCPQVEVIPVFPWRCWCDQLRTPALLESRGSCCQR